jgi:hypothetical protein
VCDQRYAQLSRRRPERQEAPRQWRGFFSARPGPAAAIRVGDFLPPATIRPKRTAWAYNKWLHTDRLVEGRIVAKRR